MPLVPATSGSWLRATLTSLQNQITALATQQQAYVLDQTAITRLLMGWQPTDGTYSIVAFDSSGNPRAQFGGLRDGNHGMAIYSQLNDGTYVEVNAPVVALTSGTLSTTSTSFTTLSGSPTLPITVGGSGKALVGISAVLGIVANDGADVELYVDGAPPATFPVISLQSSAATASSQTSQTVVTAMTQGSHTLSLVYKSVSGGTANFSNPSIFAVPY